MEKLKVQHVITEDTGKGDANFYAVTLADTVKAWGKPPIAALPITEHKYAVLFAAAPELLDALTDARNRMMGSSPAILTLIAKTDAAIRKATGE